MSASLPTSGRTGVALSVLCSVLLCSGGAAQTTWDLRARAPDRVRVGESRRCVRVCSLRCPSAPSLAAHLAARSSPIGGAGDVSRRSCRTMPKNPIHLGALARLWCGPAVLSGPHLFQGASIATLCCRKSARVAVGAAALNALDNSGNCVLGSDRAFRSAGHAKSLESRCEGTPPGPTRQSNVRRDFLAAAEWPRIGGLRRSGSSLCRDQ
jgi:hypothetical protein